MDCENCKYYPKEYRKNPPPKHMDSFCRYVYEKMRYYKGEQYRRSTMHYLNKNSDCPYFKRKVFWSTFFGWVFIIVFLLLFWLWVFWGVT